MVPRWRAASDIENGTVARLEPRAPRGGTAAAGETIAGVRVRAGSPHPVPAELLAELGSWLRAADGFDDRIERRCSPGMTFGLILARKPLPDLRETTEMAIDLGCRSLTLVTQEDSTRVTAHSYFDPSRSQIVSWIKRAFPSDADMARAR